MLNLPPLNGEQTNLLLPDLRTLEAGLTSTDADELAALILSTFSELTPEVTSFSPHCKRLFQSLKLFYPCFADL